MIFFSKRLEREIAYSGRELAPHWIAHETKQFGSALVAFTGACDVATDALVDLEDRFASDSIRAQSMLHFLGEFFGDTLEITVVRQRLLVAILGECLNRRLYKSTTLPAGVERLVERSGDDIFVTVDGRKKKLTVSIVTASAVSTLLHFGVNIDATGAPVEAVGLQDLGVSASDLADEVLSLWSKEMHEQAVARAKVLPR